MTRLPSRRQTPGKDALTLTPFCPSRDFDCRRARGTLRETDRVAPRGLPAVGGWCAVLLAASLLVSGAVAAEIEVPPLDPSSPIAVTAERGQQWTQGAYEVWHLRGACLIEQGAATARGDEMIVWIERQPPLSIEPERVIAFLEGSVQVALPTRAGESGAARVQDRSWLGRFESHQAIALRVAQLDAATQARPAIFHRALLAHDRRPDEIQQAQFTQPAPFTPGAGGTAMPGGGTRRIIAQPRAQGVRVQARTFPSPDGREQIVVVDSGVNIVITGLDQLGTVDISTDRLVMWTAALDQLDLSGQGAQRQDTPLELYLEGNIVFRQGDRVIYAQSMYYNVPQERGVVLQAEMLTPAPQYQGLLRLKADVLEQINRQQFVGTGAAATTSRLGVPRYWVQSDTVTLDDVQSPVVNPFTGQVEIDPRTGDVAVEHSQNVSATNNFVYIGGVPVLWWPTLATDLSSPGFYVQRVRVRNDGIFGTQILTDWDAYQILGIRNKPEGTRWEFSTDYLSERGPAFGTTFDYDREDAFGIPSPVRGHFDAWGIYDRWSDRHGRNLWDLAPPRRERGRILWQHLQDFEGGWRLKGELGYISDRNFLNQYFENEWDQRKDQTTGVLLTRLSENWSWNVNADVRLNDFFTQTEWLPRFDVFTLGQPIGPLVWNQHTHVGYGKLRVREPSPDPNDPSDALAWERDSMGVPYEKREGVRAGTRHELSLPFELGYAKVAPYVLGDVTHWGEDVDGQDVTRLYGQVGLRGSLPFWRVDPEARSEIWNVNGVAHKISFDADAFVAESDTDLARLPLYDPLDDDAQEYFRRRFLVPGGAFFGQASIPQQYDERYYAVRTGMQGNVAPQSMEIAEDLMAVKLGVRQRWQTKRGMPGAERIIDWIVLDIEGTLFPKPERDNFGQDVGLVNYNFRWHVGDRLALLSDGYADFFGQGLRTVSVGALMGRPEQGSFYLGMTSIEGPISSNVLTAALNYRLSEKWIGSFSTMIDFSETGNIGQRVAITRIGESFLATVGVNVDSVRDNVGVMFTLEPRFLNNSRYGRLGGVAIPPAGARGLE